MRVPRYCTEAGLALVLVLWVVTLLSVVAASFTLGVRRDAGVAHNITQAGTAQALAEAGVRLAMLGLEHPDPEQRWVPGEGVHRIQWGDIVLDVTVTSESGRVDINHADEIVLDRLLAVVGVEDPDQRASIVAQLLDWRDPDPGVRLNGLSPADYQRLGYAYGPANTRFAAVEELLLLPGISLDLFRELRPFVTTHSGQSTVDPAYADRAVLMASLGLDEAQADAWLAEREAALEAEQPVAAMNSGRVASTAGLVPGGSTVHTVTSVAELPSGVRAGVRAVLQPANPRDPEPFQFVHYSLVNP